MIHDQQHQVTLEQLVRKSAPAAWILEMHEHFARTGTYRPEDLDRVLGDPAERAKVGPSTDVKAFFGM